MIEWIIGSAVGSLVALGVGAALYERRRQIASIREAGRRLGLEVIETTGTYPRVEGRLDGIPVCVEVVKFLSGRQLSVGVEPMGFPPEVSMTMADALRESDRARAETMTPAQRILTYCSPRSANKDVLNALLHHETVMEILWSMVLDSVQLRVIDGTIYSRLHQLHSAEDYVKDIRGAVAHATQIEEALAREPIGVSG